MIEGVQSNDRHCLLPGIPFEDVGNTSAGTLDGLKKEKARSDFETTVLCSVDFQDLRVSAALKLASRFLPLGPFLFIL